MIRTSFKHRAWRRHCALQQHDTDCAAACLATVAKFHGKPTSVARLRLLCGTDRNGTTVFGLVKAATALGFKCKSLRCTPDHLPGLQLPAICHVLRQQRSHFVVLHRVNGTSCLVADPAIGLQTVAREAFLSDWTGVAVTLSPESELRVPGPPSIFEQFRSVSEPYDFVLAEIVVANLLLLGLMLSGSIYLRLVVDRVLQPGDQSLLTCMGWTLFGIFVWRAGFGALRGILVAHTARRVDTGMLTEYLCQLLHLPLSFFQACESGDTLSRVGDVLKVRELISGTTLGLLMDGASVLLSLAVLFFLSWKLALLGASVVLPVVLTLILVLRPLKRSQRLALEAGAELQSTFVETYSGIATIRSLGGESTFLARAEPKISAFADKLYRINVLSSLSGSGAELVAGAVATLVMWHGLKIALAGGLTLGGFVAFFSIFYAMLQPLLRSLTSSVAIGEAVASLDRLGDIMHLDKEEGLHSDVAEHEDPSPLPAFNPQQQLTFHNVSFAYGCRPPVLQRINLTLMVNRLTLIVGDSGGGKTTLVRLLLRHFDPTEGAILADGLPLGKFSLRSIRQRVGYVEQDPHLFQGTLLENLLFGCECVDPHLLKDVLDKLNLTSLIAKLPQGLQSVIGDRGVSLSGGQRQRVALARALLRQPRLLLLDEPSSGLDPVNEDALQRVIQSLRGQCTIVIITHRLSTFRDADQIVFLMNGSVVEQGTHFELLRTNKLYAHCWDLQNTPGFPQREAVVSSEAIGSEVTA